MKTKFVGAICPVLIYINSLPALIMAVIKQRPGAKQGFWPGPGFGMNLSII